ncbi:MAG: hypothetical protein IMZ62_16170, partial [Chloroflexi bacterium]|nr:hypothetical protein [Chloroflexota bacterium]
MSTAYGMIGTGDIPAGHKPQSYKEGPLYWDFKGRVPFTAMTAKIPTKSVNSDKHTWMVQAPPVQCGAITHCHNDPALTSAYVAAAGVDGTIIYVQLAAALAGEFLEGHTVEISEDNYPLYTIHGKVIAHPYIAAANSYLTVRLTEADTAVAGHTLANCNNITMVSSAFAHGDTRPRDVTYYPDDLYNRAQIIRTALDLTNNALKEKTRYGTSEYERVKGQKLQLHTLARERSAFWERRWEGTGRNGQPEYHQMGMVDFMRRCIAADMLDATRIADFRVDYAANTWLSKGPTWLNGKFEELFRQGTSNGERLSFCGSGAAQGVTDLGATYGNINLTPESHVYGLDISTWKTPHG